MQIVFLSNEFPPETYGGAGVHVDYLSRELARCESGAHSIRVLCFTRDPQVREPNIRAQGFPPRKEDFPGIEAIRSKILSILQSNLEFAAAMEDADVVHCHTWYTHLAGCLIRDLFQVPLVLTTHSLEPNRPWKEQQLGTGYQLSTWLEKSAYQKADGIIAVSGYMEKEVQKHYLVDPGKVQVIPNGIDTREYSPIEDAETVRSLGVDPELPYILFVGRITPQKGIFHLLNTVPRLLPGTQVVLCASSADTAQMRQDLQRQVEEIHRNTDNRVIWIERHLPQSEMTPLYSLARAFVCPSVYEPFGIINLEAMACGTPVVASETGGIPDIVEHGRTGYLVPLHPASENNPEPADAESFASGLAEAMNKVLAAPELAAAMGRNGLERVRRYFSWSSVAEQTLKFYRSLGPAKGH